MASGILPLLTVTMLEVLGGGQDLAILEHGEDNLNVIRGAGNVFVGDDRL